MNWRLTPRERRIIERTKTASSGDHPDTGQPEGEPTVDNTEAPPLWRSVLAWIGGMAFLVALAMFMLWIASRI